MKKITFIIVLIPILFCFCSNSIAQELTDEQIETIKKEVSEQFDKHLESLTQLNYELWLEFISTDNFILCFLPGVVGAMPDYRRYVGAIKDSFARRERQTIGGAQLTEITPLSPDLAFMTHTGIYENWYKTGEYRKDYCNATVLWKKEKDVWKIIHVNESWIPKND